MCVCIYLKLGQFIINSWTTIFFKCLTSKPKTIYKNPRINHYLNFFKAWLLCEMCSPKFYQLILHQTHLCCRSWKRTNVISRSAERLTLSKWTASSARSISAWNTGTTDASTHRPLKAKGKKCKRPKSNLGKPRRRVINWWLYLCTKYIWFSQTSELIKIIRK